MDHAIGPARPGDLEAVRRLLDASQLPSRDVEASMLTHFLVARRGAELIGVVGLEPLGDAGLLRSASVVAAERGRGLGAALTRALERHAQALGVRRLYLLTTTAEGFFTRLGYRTVARDEAPEAVRGTTEYRELCASTSVCMTRELEAPGSGRAGMSGTGIGRPAAGEYAPHYERYVARVGEGDVVEALRRQADETAALLAGLSDRDGDYRYAEGKWSIKEVVGHVADTERVMVYRAMCFARREPGALPGFDENAYVRSAKFGARALAGLLAEFRAVRAATVPFFEGLDAEEALRTGTASGWPVSVRGLAFIVAGHELHHRAILVERYLRGLRRE